MGVLPYSIWHRKVQTDERRRLLMHLNLLLIQVTGRNVLVDSGLGNRLTERQTDIYQPSAFILPDSLNALGLQTTDITDLILTHLHFDHAGGIISQREAVDYLTFPNAVCWIQGEEWEMAKHPSELNRAAYQYTHQLSLLAREGRIRLVDHFQEVCANVRLRWVGGHTVGSQIVELSLDGALHIYAGDIVPTRFHLPLPVTSAYDVSRTQTVAAKQYIYERLRTAGGYLLLDHDTADWSIPISDINY